MRKSQRNRQAHESARSGVDYDDNPANETGVLLMQDTFDENLLSEDHETDESTDVSFIIPVGHTRFYHRCFKVNLCLNISMLITFVGLITFGPWYTMSYQGGLQ